MDAANASRLEAAFGDATAEAILGHAITTAFSGRIALVSSFGIEAAVLLDLVARTDPATPILFLDTEKLFPETLRYRARLVNHLGLTDVRVLKPDAVEIANADPGGDLWAHDPDRCCYLRKVLPLERALAGFDAWITGRKRYQGGLREALPVFEHADGRIKVNPLAKWRPEDIPRYFMVRDLPRHPMSKVGYSSIGCVPCTAPPKRQDDPRSGRWPGSEKTECGIHFSIAWAPGDSDTG